MFDFLEKSAFFGVAISVVSYGIGMLLKKKFKLAILNPLLISIVITIAFLALTGISYEKYDEGAKYLSYLLTPRPFAWRFRCMSSWNSSSITGVPCCWASCPACFPAWA